MTYLKHNSFAATVCQVKCIPTVRKVLVVASCCMSLPVAFQVKRGVEKNDNKKKEREDQASLSSYMPLRNTQTTSSFAY